MKFLVTGGAGFIGSCLIWKLNSVGIDDILVVDATDERRQHKNLSGKAFRDYIERDRLSDYLKEGALSKDVDIVIHFGASTSTTEKDRDFLYKNNFLYSRELAKWALINNISFLYASSAAVYGAGELGYSDDDSLTPGLKPLNEYGVSKLSFDKWVVENALQKRFVGFRFFNVYGPNEYHKADMRSMVNKGYHQIKESGRIRLFKSYKKEYKDGEQKRDFIYVKDAVDIVYYFIDHPDKRGIFNVGTGKARAWNEVAAALFSALGIEPDIEYFDMPEDIKGQYQYYTEADLTKLKEAIGDYRFRDLKEAVRDYVGYLESGAYL